VDLLLIHWPDESVPLAETLGAMRELKAAGKAKAIGVSNFPVRLMEQAVAIAGDEIACNQVEYHLLLSQAPVLDFARRHGIAVTAYCPLARGRLTGHKLAEQVARKHGKTVSQVGLRWLVEQASSTRERTSPSSISLSTPTIIGCSTRCRARAGW
jgi:2,5-diketo-D-gluconate reductase B